MFVSKMTNPLLRAFRRFNRDEGGYITVEAVIVLPVLLWLFAAGWVYFDAFRQQAVNQKANYVISDMISRETDPIDASYITNAYNLLRELNRSVDSEDSDLRVSVVRFDTNANGWRIEWSQRGGQGGALSDQDLDEYISRLPTGLPGDQLILVETWDVHDPVFSVGLGTFEIQTYSFTRPRYAPQVVFSNT